MGCEKDGASLQKRTIHQVGTMQMTQERCEIVYIGIEIRIVFQSGGTSKYSGTVGSEKVNSKLGKANGMLAFIAGELEY